MTTLGRYEILDKIGAGSMGTVYRARDSILDRMVALKTIRTGLEIEPELRERFYREAKACARLQHRGLITVFDLGEVDRIAYIAMELLVGSDFQGLINKRTELSLTTKIEAMAQVCEALAYAHRHGIIHRDIKPSNLFLAEDQNAKILDFGIARMPSSRLTLVGKMLGTPNYMAPEQLLAKPIDSRSDLFSAALVFFELLVYVHPFQSEMIPKRLVDGQPDSLFEHNPKLPMALDKIFTRALAKDPDLRYRTGDEFAMDLRAVLEVSRQGTSTGFSSVQLPSDQHAIPRVTADVPVRTVDASLLTPPPPGEDPYEWRLSEVLRLIPEFEDAIDRGDGTKAQRVCSQLEAIEAVDNRFTDALELCRSRLTGIKVPAALDLPSPPPPPPVPAPSSKYEPSTTGNWCKHCGFSGQTHGPNCSKCGAPFVPEDAAPVPEPYSPPAFIPPDLHETQHFPVPPPLPESPFPAPPFIPAPPPPVASASSSSISTPSISAPVISAPVIPTPVVPETGRPSFEDDLTRQFSIPAVTGAGLPPLPMDLGSKRIEPIAAPPRPPVLPPPPPVEYRRPDPVPQPPAAPSPSAAPPPRKGQIAAIVAGALVILILLGVAAFMLRPAHVEPFVATAVVAPASADLFKTPGDSSAIAKLSKGDRVNVLRLPRDRDQEWVQAQVASSKLTTRPGYVRSADLDPDAWDSSDAATKLDLIRMFHSGDPSDAQGVRAQAARFQAFIGQFPNTTQSREAELEIARLEMVQIRRVQGSGQPQSAWANLVDSVRRHLDAASADASLAPEIQTIRGELGQPARPGAAPAAVPPPPATAPPTPLHKPEPGPAPPPGRGTPTGRGLSPAEIEKNLSDANRLAGGGGDLATQLAGLKRAAELVDQVLKTQPGNARALAAKDRIKRTKEVLEDLSSH